MLLRAVFLCCVWATFVHGDVQGGLRNCIRWPDYVTPNDLHICTCWAAEAEAEGSDAILQWESWEGHAVAQGYRGQGTLGLSLDDLPAGTEVVRPLRCLLLFPANASKVLLGTYLPVLAYGPENVTITTNRPYIPDNGANMTLTCSAEVNPRPRFEWDGHPPGAVRIPGCVCANGSFSETLTFSPKGFKDGDVIRCRVTNSASEWPMSQTAQFVLRTEPHQPRTVSLQHYLAVSISLAAMLLTSLLLLFLQWWRNRKNRGATYAENTERKQLRGDGDRQVIYSTDSDGNPLMESYQSYASGLYETLDPENASIQTSEGRQSPH